MQLTEEELEIFSRQLLIKDWSYKNQLALKESIVQLDTENEILARYLISAGIGRLIIKSDSLYRNLLGFELCTELTLESSLSELPKLDLNISITSQDNQSILCGITEASKAITALIKIKMVALSS